MDALSVSGFDVEPDIKADLDIATLAGVTAMIETIFRPLIVQEGATGEEQMIMEFPGYTHIGESDVVMEILGRGYTTDGDSMYFGKSAAEKVTRPNLPELEVVTDDQIVELAVSDAIVTYRRMEFKIPDSGRLEVPVFDRLCEFAHDQASKFYRISEADVARGFIQVSSRHSLRAGQPPGSRFRHWTSVLNYAKLYVSIFQDDQIQDKVAGMIEYDVKYNMQHDRWLLRWQEAGVI